MLVDPDSGNPCEDFTFCLGADCAAPTCDDETACNTGAEGDCEYAADGFDCDGNSTCDATLYTYVCGGGSYDSEMSWGSDCDGSSGAAGDGQFVFLMVIMF